MKKSLNEISSSFLIKDDFSFWKEILYTHLTYEPLPLIVNKNHIISAAAMWAYVKIWKEHFREKGAKSGDTILLALSESPEWIMILLASFWENLRVILCDPKQVSIDTIPEVWGIFSEDKNITNWTFSEQLTPICLREPNQLYKNESIKERICFHSYSSSAKILDKNKTEKKINQSLSDKQFAEFISKVKIENKPKGVLSSLPWFSPIGFYFDFFLNYFSKKEIFLTQKFQNPNIEYTELFNAFSIDKIITTTQQSPMINQCALISTKSHSEIEIICFEERELNDISLLFMDSNFSFSEKRNSISNQ
ncbi:MAG: hypothetical protein SH817_10560 [Leptospira sp.]|nr:hypothetical protein [Leptospira sp.]